MIRRKIPSALLEREPYEVWNAFVDLVATERYADLDEVQRAAHLSFWYDSEVQNGGHLQYFENRGTYLLDETVTALGTLGADCQHGVLKVAGRLFLSRQRDRIATREQYVTTAMAGEFDSFDAAYHACQPSMQKLLEDYLERHRERFVEITGA